MPTLADDPDRYLATVAEMLVADGKTDAVEILRTATVRVEETGWDNWDGGITLWTIYLLIHPVA